MIDAHVNIRTGAAERTVPLSAYLDATAEENAHEHAYGWIKQLRHARVDGRAFRQRFTIRGDSLWWFTEIYLHRERAIVDTFRTIAATRALIAREQPSDLRVEAESPVVRQVTVRTAVASGVNAAIDVEDSEWNRRLRHLKRRATSLTFTAWASRLKSKLAPAVTSPAVAAFVHRAFWRAGTSDGSAESYIGPVLAALENRVGPQGIQYVGIGPPVNFRARHWWKELRPPSGEKATPVERFAPWATLRDSREIWRGRAVSFRAICDSEDIRTAAVIDGIDCWPVVREQLAGVVYLQWPWSARAMDEAAAALDALRPSTVVTYAEAGGWGRALILEARRRGIPSAGLQHGFIYRQWLNYLHEPDEILPGARGDAGFPRPSVTLLFDGYAARHLREEGRLPETSLKVTGSPQLDALLSRLATIREEEIHRLRTEAAIRAGDKIILVATKEKEARHVLPALVDAAGALPGVRLMIKPHPAETREAYANIAAPCVTILSASTDLALLLAASRAVVTVNSTVALDAAVTGIPGLVIGLPNNLSPFVDAGALAGAREEREIASELQRVLYDEEFRQQLTGACRAMLGIPAFAPGSTAASRSADAILDLTARRRTGTDS